MSCTLRSRHILRRFKSTLQDIQTSREYLEYGRLNQKDVTSTTFRGTLYELYAKEYLEHRLHCYEMTRVGGAMDNGIDIFGKWNLGFYWNRLTDEKKSKKYPQKTVLSASKQYNEATGGKVPKQIDLENQIQVFVQCKNYKRRIQASTIRELAGIYEYHAKTALDRMRTFFFLLLPFALTKQAQRQFDISSVPLVHFKVSSTKVEEADQNNQAVDTLDEPPTIYMNPKARLLLQGLEQGIVKNQF